MKDYSGACGIGGFLRGSVGLFCNVYLALNLNSLSVRSHFCESELSLASIPQFVRASFKSPSEPSDKSGRNCRNERIMCLQEREEKRRDFIGGALILVIGIGVIAIARIWRKS